MLIKHHYHIDNQHILNVSLKILYAIVLAGLVVLTINYVNRAGYNWIQHINELFKGFEYRLVQPYY